MSGDRHLRAVEESGEGPFSCPEAPELALLTAQQRRDLRRAKRAALWVGLILPLALSAAAAAILVAWLPRMPDPMASHWSGTGGPDGFMSPAANIATFAGLGAGMSLLFGLLAVLGAGGATVAVWSGMNRFLAAMSLSMVSLIMTTAVLSAQMQLDLVDARDAPGIGGAMAIGFGAAGAAGVIGFFAQPRLRIESSTRGEPADLELGDGERAVWVGEIRPSRVFAWVLGSTLLLCGATALWLAISGEPSWWILGGTFVLMSALAVTCAWFRVRVDRNGLEVRSLAGWPRFRVAADDVERVEVRGIHPLAEWGGWGLRWVPGTGLGIVMRTGEGIVITRRDGRIFALTVDDAATGAALLDAVSDRREQRGTQNV